MVNDVMWPGMWRFPRPFLEDIEDMLPRTNFLNGLSISEDEKNVYVEAAVPGIDPKDVEITFDKGVLAIRAEKKEEEKRKKFQRRATSSFFYRVAPGGVDPKAEPTATYQHGVMKVAFVKSTQIKPKRIAVKIA